MKNVIALIKKNKTRFAAKCAVAGTALVATGTALAQTAVETAITDAGAAAEGYVGTAGGVVIGIAAGAVGLGLVLKLMGKI